MRLLLLTILAACAAAPRPTPEVPALDDAAAIARAHEFFAAVDRRDSESFRALVGSGFVLFEDGGATAADELSRMWAASSKQGRPPRTRTCADEVVHRGDGAIVYFGDCTEHVPAYGDRPASEWQGWNTLVMVREQGAWKIALWQWDLGGIEAERTRWNAIYRRDFGFTKQPTGLLVRAVDGVTPGTALVVAMGQGRNALYLASQGWKVTGIDIADEGIRRARDAAAERGLELDAVVADASGYDFGAEQWDLVTMLYAGGNHDWIERIKPSVKPGGLFVLEFFHKQPGAPGGGVDREQLVSAFSGWEIVTDEVVEDKPDWGPQQTKLVRFVARKR